MTYPLRRRTPAETRAYFQGFNSGIEAAAQVAESRAKVWEEATRADMHSPCAMSLWEECEDIAQHIRRYHHADGEAAWEGER